LHDLTASGYSFAKIPGSHRYHPGFDTDAASTSRSQSNAGSGHDQSPAIARRHVVRVRNEGGQPGCVRPADRSGVDAVNARFGLSTAGLIVRR